MSRRRNFGSMSAINWRANLAAQHESEQNELLESIKDSIHRGKDDIQTRHIQAYGNVTVSGHMSINGVFAATSLQAGLGTEIANNTGSSNSQTLTWSDDGGKINKCVSAFASGTKPVVIAAATSADLGKKITIIQTVTPGNGAGDMTFSLTTQTFDGAGVIETHAGSNGTAGTVGAVTFSTNGDNTLTLTNGNSSSNNLFGIGTQITFEVVSTTKIRATVVAYPAGTGAGGSIAFSTV